MKTSNFQVSLEAEASYRLGDAILVKFELENPTNKTFWLLNWGTPLEGEFTRDSFVVERDGKRIPYDGKLVSRGDPGADSYVALAPGDRIEQQIDISDAYAVDETGEYTVTLTAIFFDVFVEGGRTKFSPRKRHDHQRVKLPSATVKFTVVEGGVPKKTKGQIARALMRRPDTDAQEPTFSGGTTTDRDEVTIAHNNAQYFAALAVRQLDDTGGSTNTLYQTWFGAFDQGRYDTVRDVFNDVNNELVNQQVTYDLSGSGCGSTWNAYTYNNSSTVWTCSGFWGMDPIPDSADVNCQFSTILHEWTHAASGTKDHAYGDTDCQNLAINDPDDAVENADSYENFAERLALSDFGKSLTFITDRSQFGRDEVDALLEHATPSTVDNAFYVHADGFWPELLGITVSSLGSSPDVVPTVTISPSIPGMTVEVTSLQSEDSALPATPQRFTWVLAAKFTNTDGFPNIANSQELVTLTATLSGISASAQIRLIKESSPYELDGAVSWLSTDLRVFQIRAGDSRFGATMGTTPESASTFIKEIISNLESGNSGGQTFDSISTDQQTSALELAQQVNGTNVYNFAVAKVRYVGPIEVSNVRVFFRLFPVSTTSTTFEPNTTYRRFTDGDRTIPILGLSNAGDLLTIPFFAEPRVNSESVELTDQTDPDNVKSMDASPAGGETVAYFGAWLDTNQTQAQFPSTPSPADGPWASGRKTVQELIKNAHQCLVAEIAYDGDPISSGATPGGSDKLAQRNLSIVPAANPGEIASHRIPNVFELWPASLDTEEANSPDELLIEWRNTPKGSIANIFIPEIDAAQIVALADERYATHTLKQVDKQTIQLPVGGISYVPLPRVATLGLTGLLWVDLPATVHKGEEYTIVVRQVTDRTETPIPIVYDVADRITARYETIVKTGKKELPRWRHIVGSYQITIPVRTKEVLVAPEIRLLSVLRWILKSMSTDDRWYAVFSKYVGMISQRVAALGGDPTHVEPSPLGGKGGTGANPVRAPKRTVNYDGKVGGLMYDCYGDFEGFILNGCCGEELFYAREYRIEALVKTAWRERIAITVVTEAECPRRPLSIILRRAPEPFQA
jgi:hypothetical protein